MKPCPCCAGIRAAALPWSPGQEVIGAGAWTVVCQDCCMRTAWYKTRQGAEEAWDMRRPAALDTGNLVSDPLYLALDALYERGWADCFYHRKYDQRGTKEWQAALDLFRLGSPTRTVADDVRDFGQGFSLDGKRVDPSRVTVHLPKGLPK